MTIYLHAHSLPGFSDTNGWKCGVSGLNNVRVPCSLVSALAIFKHGLIEFTLVLNETAATKQEIKRSKVSYDFSFVSAVMALETS